MRRLKLALAQIDTRLGDLSSNLEGHLETIERARSEKADLLLFPELSLTGYFLQDLTPTVARRPVADDPTFAPLLDASRHLDLVVGFVEAGDGHRYYNSAVYLSAGQVSHLHRKVYLPTYGMFDDARFFGRGAEVRAFDTRFGRFGLLICEDFWHASAPYLLWLDGAEVMLFPAASPGRGLASEERVETARWVETVNQAFAGLFTCFVANTNRVGFEDGLHFWGGATAFDPNGRLLARGPDYQEALTLAELDLDEVARARARLPLLRDELPLFVQRELGRILGDRAAEDEP